MAKLSERVDSINKPMSASDYGMGVSGEYSIGTVFLTKTGETKMGIRKVNLTLVDNNDNLKGAEKIVFEQQVVTEHDNDKTIQQVLITGDVSTALDAHNKKREATVDKSILRSTGTKVFLEPVEIFELQWQVIQVG